jgi:S1-C subfamily serine protease
VKCEIRILSGARAGRRDVFEKSYLGLGRHPLSDVRFDAEQDLDVSTRHAAVLKSGEGWVLRDLGSTNGTYLNGERLAGDRPLSDGDVIRLGVHGPEASFHLIHAEAEVVMPAVPRESVDQPARPAPPAPAAPAPPRRSPAPAPPAAAAAPSATSVLRAQIRDQASRFRALVVMLVIVLAGAAGLLVWQGLSAREERVALGSVLDSLGRELVSLRSAKVAQDSLVARLQREVARETDPGRRSALQRQYDDARQRQRSMAVAQGVDYNAIVRDNHAAVAVIYVRFADTTEMWTGTAFSVSSNGVMLTNRHVVTNSRGERPRDLAIQFSGSAEVHPARLVRVAPDLDLAVVQLESAGPFPAVAGLASDIAGLVPGEPIAILGFPGGGGEGVDVPRATLGTGTITGVDDDSLLTLDAFSGIGASGSPIFDRNGRVIGVEFGGRSSGTRSGASRTIFGIPIRRALGLLPS